MHHPAGVCRRHPAAQFGWLAGYGGLGSGRAIPSRHNNCGGTLYSRGSQLDREIMTASSSPSQGVSPAPDLAALWSSARRLHPVYVELAREFVIEAPAFAALDEPVDAPDRETVEHAQQWLQEMDDRIQVHQLRQFLQTSSLVDGDGLVALLQHFLTQPTRTDSSRDKIDFLLEQGRKAKVQAGDLFYLPIALVAFTRFGYLMRRVFFRLMLADLNNILDGLTELEEQGVETIDCRRAQFSAQEPIVRLRMICQSWKVMFQAEYSSGQPLRMLVDLRASVDGALGRGTGAKAAEAAPTQAAPRAAAAAKAAKPVEARQTAPKSAPAKSAAPKTAAPPA